MGRSAALAAVDAPPDATAQPEAPTAPKTEQTTAAPDRINLLDKNNGGHLAAASSDDWLATIDGDERAAFVSGWEAVYAFKDERPATFDLFTTLIAATADSNVKEFELLAGSDGPTGTFTSLGKFSTQNIKLFKTPYQEFPIGPVTAKYFKVRLISLHGVSSTQIREFQLFGHLNPS